MSEDGELIPLADRERWESALEGIEHAFGHTWASCHAMHATTGHDTYLYCYRSRETVFVCPIAERSFAGEIDVATPFGFSGFAGRGDASRLMSAWGRFARRRGYVAGYIALNPLLAGEAFAGVEGVTAGPELFFLDLSKSEDDLLSAMKSGRRRPILRWQREGSPLVSDHDQLSEFLVVNFARFMRSLGAGPTYRFTEETLRRLVASPGAILLGVPNAGAVEAAVLFCPTPTIGEAMFTVSAGGGGRHIDVLVWAGALELQRREVRWLSLGGGITRDDGVAAVKRGYRGIAREMPVLRQVYDRVRYDRLCQAAGVDPHPHSGYFPPWHGGARHVR